MDVRLSAEQHALRDAAAQVVDRLGPSAVGQLDDSERTDKLDAAVAASGWRELRTATDDGFPWASGVEVALVAEELGRALADAAFLGPTLAAELRRLAGAPAATTPETVAFVADLSRPATAEDVAIGTSLAIDAGGATVALVLTPGASGASIGSVALGSVGGASATVTTDLTRPVAPIAAGATVTPLADSAGALGERELDRWTAFGLAVTSADLVGSMAGAVALATEYATQRQQYDRRIGSFQAVQHLLADAFVLAEGSRSVTRHAAWAADALDPTEALAAAAVAKAYCSRAARTVCETSIQVHGGIGNTWECLAHVHLRRALLSTDVLGGVGPSLERVVANHRGGDRGLR